MVSVGDRIFLVGGLQTPCSVASCRGQLQIYTPRTNSWCVRGCRSMHAPPPPPSPPAPHACLRGQHTRDQFVVSWCVQDAVSVQVRGITCPCPQSCFLLCPAIVVPCAYTQRSRDDPGRIEGRSGLSFHGRSRVQWSLQPSTVRFTPAAGSGTRSSHRCDSTAPGMAAGQTRPTATGLTRTPDAGTPSLPHCEHRGSFSFSFRMIRLGPATQSSA